MNLTRKIALQSALLVAVAVAAAGCGTTKPKPIAWNLSIKKATQSSIKVDVVGMNQSQKPYWENAKVADYWNENSPMREGANKKPVKFEGNPPVWTLDRVKDKATWDNWFKYGSAYLMIIADLPGGPFGDGPFDRRRLIVPLDKNVWNAKNKTLEFEIQDGMINALTPQNPGS